MVVASGKASGKMGGSSKKAPSTPNKVTPKREKQAQRMASKKGAVGSVDTPVGRRSARIARKKTEAR